jgi:hypothetical protein
MRQRAERVGDPVGPFLPGGDGLDAAKRQHQLRELGRINAPIDHDTFDAGLLQAAHQLAHVLRRARHRHVANHELVPDDADGDRWRGGVHPLQRVGERLDGARHEGMFGRVQLRAT